MDGMTSFGNEVSQKMREAGLNVACDYSDKAVGDRIKKATKNNIPFFAVLGTDEEKNKKIVIKSLDSRKEAEYPLTDAGIKNLVEELKPGKHKSN